MTATILTRISAVTGALIVALGAFGAHGLEGRLSAEAQDWWQTATLYGLAHAVLATALSASRSPSTGAIVAFLSGVWVFSGSLYALALTDFRLLGAITPIGGTAFLVGWAWLAASAQKR